MNIDAAMEIQDMKEEEFNDEYAVFKKIINNPEKYNKLYKGFLYATPTSISFIFGQKDPDKN